MGDDSPNVVLVFESIDANRSIDTIRLIGPAWAYTAGELATAKTRTLDIKLRCPSNFAFQMTALMPPWMADRHAC